MILVLSSIALLIIGIVLMIIGHRYENKHDYDGGENCTAWSIGSLAVIIGGFFSIIFGISAFLAHTNYIKDLKRIEIEERRTAIVEELGREETDILQKGIERAENFNVDIRTRQRRLNSPVFNWVTSPVWGEFESIEY